MRIDRLGVDEGQRLREIRLLSLREEPDAFASTYEETVARLEASWRKQLEELATFVAANETGDVGMVRACAYDGRPGTAILLSMWVAPEARGRGVGDALIDSIIDWARAESYDAVALEVGDDNASAIALYARHGFVPTGRTATLPPPRDHITEHERERKLVVDSS